MLNICKDCVETKRWKVRQFTHTVVVASAGGRETDVLTRRMENESTMEMLVTFEDVVVALSGIYGK